MNLDLAEIGRAMAPGAHGVVVLDGAGWHGAKALDLPDNISLLTLPPYSPELNPAENIWQYLRQNYLANRVFDDCDAILGACCPAWNAFADAPAIIASVTPRDWPKTTA